MKLDFEKWDDGRWYAVIPDWTGDQEDLEMVDGADLLLEALTTDGFTASVEFICDEEPKNPEDYVYAPLIDHDDFGGTYRPEPNQWFNSTFWLCNVTHFLLGEHPEAIYFRPL